ncbi:small acid-soluble spore protein Tlp [Vallitalea pronyensis]|uniref:Protein Tlp homolog n=1 Tax=Vallitalea pronyensis TaxID=1348613 RepID=A0A8J8MH20_9FIRM|nr:small acid-soluble spore protein Tlp [Vallitalea pronyensis]QUI21352.1 small acid-soluble spore protein Tlp [Vallitalea pronyensis]
MRHKEDDRTDNVDRIQFNIDKTIQNMNRAEDMMEETDDEKARQALEDKNERRRDALTGMREEIKDEAIDKQDDYR